MSRSTFQEQESSSFLSGGNMAYVDALYEDYLADPASVPEDWRLAFENLTENKSITEELSHKAIRAYFLQQGQKKNLEQPIIVADKQAKVTALIDAYRSVGHYAAHLDPLGLSHAPRPQSLDLSYHQLKPEDLNANFYAGNYFSDKAMSLKELLQVLTQTYSSSLGFEYMHLSSEQEIAWLQEKIEGNRGRLNLDKAKKRELLQQLITADGLERYLATRYVGQKRFSLEGGDALIPLLKEIVSQGGNKGVGDIVIGMAHRGRLNVLVNVLGKEPDLLFQEFEGKISYDRTGDVKYHMGFSSNVRMPSGAVVHLALAFNPSHLEIIAPVVQGSVRTRLERRQDLAKKDQVLAVVIHGDAAMTGQGVVMEAFNFSQTRGYSTGGTLHIVVNNQVGFTTSEPQDARSSLYCTDVAKMVQAPVFHVNADDPEAVLFAAELAFEFRMKFKRDVVIDLVCYRRNGHNEADEPSITQPTMYKKIKSMKPLHEIYAKKLIEQGLLETKEPLEWIEAYRSSLDKGEVLVDTVPLEDSSAVLADWKPYLQGVWTDSADTSISLETIQELTRKLHQLPEGFVLHSVVKKMLAEREKMSQGEVEMNWGYAETMAYASLLHQGYAIRLSGQDSGRGTFAHRHAILHDLQSGETFIPLDNTVVNPAKPFAVIDSVLSEEAVLAFEYGYASSSPETLVIWEAQFGDFANGAQVVIDQFISSGEQKWGRLCGLVLFLPHGYEGQGPEHSSARLERFMQLCAQHNMQVCLPTTPAQIFHLLRRQLLRNFRKPLVVMTPKSILRHKLAVSPLIDLQEGEFQTVIAEIDPLTKAEVDRIILCTGKVYYDLLEARREHGLTNVAIIRIEQLYPFPKEALAKALAQFPAVKELTWCQEEPQNQGAWFAIQHHILECLKTKQRLSYAGRPFAAAPSVGSVYVHTEEQKALVAEALHLGKS